MFEVLILVGVALIAASFMVKTDRGQGKPTEADIQEALARRTKPEGSKGPATPESLRSVPRDARFAFVSAFGIRPQNLRELHVYTCAGKLEEFPHKVGDLLRKLYLNGSAVGEEMMALVNRGRMLKEGEAIYVAVERDDATNRSRTIAFLDRHRPC